MFTVETKMKKTAILPAVLVFLSMLIIPTRAEGENQNSLHVEEITFRSSHFKIVGDLMIPGKAEKPPVVIFVHGDGPARRYPSLKYNKLIQQVFKSGFALFYYDKPGYGESEGKFTPGLLFKERASILVDTVAHIKQNTNINPKRIGVMGISQAGYVMPLAIAQLDDISFMIAISCPARNSIDQSAYLVEKQLLCEGYTKKEAQKVKRYYIQRAKARSYKKYKEAAEFLSNNPFIKSIGWGKIKSEERFKPINSKSQALFNPVIILRRTKIPVLAIFGELDTQIDPIIGVRGYTRALKRANNKNFLVKLFPNADHGINITETGCLKEIKKRARQGNIEPVPEYLELITDWLKKLIIHLNQNQEKSK
jgi:dipeptidyl aminopeptidase/acylaminoacyl peptidase